MALSDDEIYQLTESIVNSTPGGMTRAQWRSRLQDQLAGEGTIEQRAPAPGSRRG
jgi:hypothetical protein